MTTILLKTIPILRWKVELQRGPSGFGFGLRGGRDHNLPFYILRVAPQVEHTSLKRNRA